MGFAFFGAVHYWFPKMYGRMYNLKYANTYAVIQFVGFTLLYFPQFIIGFQGMPRRYFDYLPKFQPGQIVSGIGAIVFGIGFYMMMVHLIKSAYKGKIAEANPWGGTTLEWMIPSPPPVDNFGEHLPVITEEPYNYK
jgi:cytochrome c oxidase subunit 1